MKNNSDLIKRDMNIERMRFFAMLSIIIVHIINKGGILHSLGYNNLKFFVINLFYIIEISSVNIFAMITGYLYVNKKEIKSKNLFSLLISMFFWSCLITFIFYTFNLFDIRRLGYKFVLKGIFPFLDGRYWYIICYIVLFFSIPFINKLIENLKKEDLEKLILLFFILFCVVTTLCLNVDLFHLDKGFSPFWLIYCYFIGAYIQLYKKEKQNNDKLIKKLALIIGITVILNFMLRNIGTIVFHTNRLNDLFVIYNSPFLVAISYFLFLIFQNGKAKENKIITFLASNAFAVYIIHSHKYVYDFLLNNCMRFLIKCNALIIILIVCFSALIIYIVCSVAEESRKFIFKKVKLNKAIEWIGKKVDKKININKSS